MAVDDREVAREIERALAARPVEPIAGVTAARTVCIAGVVQDSADLRVAPVSGRRCAMWEIAIHRRPYPFHAMLGEAPHRARGGVPFVVVDATGGRAVIAPQHARIDLARAMTAISRPGSRAVGQWLASTGSHPISGDEWAEEGVITAGDEIVVIGPATREVDPEAPPGGYRDQVATRLRVGGSADMPVLIAHERPAGMIGKPLVARESAIADLRPGTLAIVTGTVTGAGVGAPATRRSCAAWSVIAHAAPYAVRSPVAAIATPTPFWLEDEVDPGHRVLVDPAGAVFDGFGLDSRIAPFGPELAAVLEARGVGTALWVEEAVVPIQGGVTVDGLVVDDRDDDDDDDRPRLRLVSAPRRPLVIRPR